MSLSPPSSHAEPASLPPWPEAEAPPPPQLDVAIVGGGPGGLAAAKAILTARPDLRVGVFERCAVPQRSAALMVMPNGMASLAAISPELAAAVEVLDIRQEALRRYSADGRLVEERQGQGGIFGYIRQHGGPLSFCAWHDLQATLAAALPPGVLHQEAPLERLEEGPACLTLHLGGGRPPVTARLVVGADGGQSAVRRQVLNDGPPNYMGNAVWRAVMAPPALWEGSLAPGTHYVFHAAPPSMLSMVPLNDGQVSWQAFGAWPAERLGEIGGAGAAYVQDPVARREQGEARRRRCLEVFGGWCPQVRNLIGRADPLAITEHPQLYRDPGQCQAWGRGRATLLGDAAHLSTTYLGQGPAQAFEDALALGRAIGEHGASEVALRAYEAARQPQNEPVHRTAVGCSLDFRQGKQPPSEYALSHELGIWRSDFAPLRPAIGAVAE